MIWITRRGKVCEVKDMANSQLKSTVEMLMFECRRSLKALAVMQFERLCRLITGRRVHVTTYKGNVNFLA